MATTTETLLTESLTRVNKIESMLKSVSERVGVLEDALLPAFEDGPKAGSKKSSSCSSNSSSVGFSGGGSEIKMIKELLSLKRELESI